MNLRFTASLAALTAWALLGASGCETLEPNPGPQPGQRPAADGGTPPLDLDAAPDGSRDPDEPEPDPGEPEPSPEPEADAGEEPADARWRDGRLLYLRYCAVCHGPDGSGGPPWPESIRDMTDTFEVVHEGRGEMPAFPSLSEDDVLAIEHFLSGDPNAQPPVVGPDEPGGADGGVGEPVEPLPELTPQEVYATTCAVCHGVAGDGTQRGPQIRYPVRDYATWVVRNGRPGWGFAEAMPAYDRAQLADDTLSAIFDWLGSFERPPHGGGLYRAFCGNCHGPGGGGGWVEDSIRGEPLSEYLEAVREGEGGRAYWDREEYMPAWSVAELSAEELHSIWFVITGGLPGIDDDDDDDDEDHDEYADEY